MLKFVCFIAAILISIVLSNKTKISLGVWTLAFAVLFGAIFLGKTGSQTIQAYFPIKFVPLMITSMLFFGIVSGSGTLTIMTKKVARKLKGGKSAASAIVLFFLSLIMAVAMGRTDAVLFALSPFAVDLMVELGLNPALGVLAVWGGWTSVTVLPWTMLGIINGGLADTSFGEPTGTISCWTSNGILTAFLLILTIAYLIYCNKKDYSQFSGVKVSDDNSNEVLEYTPEQKKVLVVLAIVTAMIILPQLCATFIKADFMGVWKRFDVGFWFTIGALVLFCMKTANAGEVIKKMPWGMIVLLFGTCCLFGMAGDLGVIDILIDVASMMPKFLIAPVLAIIGGFLSMFVSGAVLCPLFIPLCGGLAAAAGCSIPFMVSIVITGTAVSSCSPASGAGASCLATISDEKVSAFVSNKMFILSVVNMFAFAVFIAAIQFLFPA